MMTGLGVACLVLGAAISAIAAAGVLRLSDFFMRMHAATKAGVAGSGFILLGVACLDGTLETWLKVVATIVFLVLTTPLAGHLLGRAAYVSGAPFWPGTAPNQLEGVLPRGRFGARRSSISKPRSGGPTTRS